MSDCDVHAEHQHVHGPGCGHAAIPHGKHTDYLHGGHLHHEHGDHIDEHTLPTRHPGNGPCLPMTFGLGHGHEHEHGPDCGHESIPHGAHTDYIVGGALHHWHGDHCDDHGPVPRLRF